MRVLILSANTGAGHNSAARSLEEHFKRINLECETWDCVSFISQRASNLVSRGHNQFYLHFPRLFGMVYRFQETHSNRWIYDLCMKGVEALHAKIQENPFDAVLCVHTFSAMMYTGVRRRFNDKTPAAFVATDYTASPGVASSDLDMYFVPHRMLFSEFIRSGVSADKMIATGIPIRDVFYQKVDTKLARERLGLPTDKSMLLLSCGSMGAGHMEKAALRLLKELPKDAFLTVICGNNVKTYNELLPHASDSLVVVGFTEEIDLYMSATDVYITKPGGLTTSEAIAKRTPMIFINAVPGCESRNFDFLTHSGVAVGAHNWREVATLAKDLLASPEKRKEQILAMEQFSEIHAAESICKHVNRELRYPTTANE